MGGLLFEITPPVHIVHPPSPSETDVPPDIGFPIRIKRLSGKVVSKLVVQ